MDSNSKLKELKSRLIFKRKTRKFNGEKGEFQFDASQARCRMIPVIDRTSIFHKRLAVPQVSSHQAGTSLTRDPYRIGITFLHITW